MTSSLVGSEMCIRDSPRCLLVKALMFPPQELSEFQSKSTSSSKTAVLSVCLLYTSDAADDM
eukprot:10997501-Prorocentrum_lima.AAC.1